MNDLLLNSSCPAGGVSHLRKHPIRAIYPIIVAIKTHKTQFALNSYSIFLNFDLSV